MYNLILISSFCCSENIKSREPKFLSFLTKIKDSFLPSFTQKLPEPQLFVDLRRLKNRNNVQNERIFKNQIDKNVDDQRQILLPTRIPPIYEESSKEGNEKMKRYMNDLREKIKTMYKEEKKVGDKTIMEIETKIDFGEKVNKSQNNVDENQNFHEELNGQNDKDIQEVSKKQNVLQKRRMDVKDVFEKDSGYQNRRIDLDDVINKFVKYQSRRLEETSEESRFS